jgi:hypothetical protein
MSTPLQDLIHADPWATELVDLPSLNAKASGAIVDAIAAMRKTARQAPCSLRGRSIVVLGPAGAGKTHLFARLRRVVGPRAVFVHVRPLIGAEMSPRYLLREIVAQLAYETHGFRQVDALVGSLVGHLDGGSARMPRAFIEVFSAMTDEQRAQQLEVVIDQVMDRWPQVDEVYLRYLLSTPFVPATKQRALLAWLSGREPDEVQLARIGAREGLRDDLIMPALKTLGVLAAPGAPIVIVFDQLENLIDAEGANRVRAYGNLVAELVDEVRGVVLVQMALDSEWARAIEPELATSQKTRATMDRQILALPTPDQREELLRLWIQRLPGSPELPEPFGAERVRSWRQTPGLTPRMLLIACLRALDDSVQSSDAVEPIGGVDDAEQAGEAIEQAWTEHLSQARKLLDTCGVEERCVEAEALADGWSAAIRFTPGLHVVSTSHVRPAQVIIQRERDRVHLALLTKGHPRSLMGSLDAIGRLAEREHVLVVRELAQSFKPTWKASIERRERLLRMPKVQWLELGREDAARLLALRTLVADARSRDVTDLAGRPLDERAVMAWIETTLDIAAWQPIQALLQKPAVAEQEPQSSPPTPGQPSERPAPGPAEAPAKRPAWPTQRSTPAGPSRAQPEQRPAAASQAQALRLVPLSGDRPGDGALSVLSRLRVASVDRVVREVCRVQPSRTRRDVLAELRVDAHRVRWYGATVVAWKEHGV